jgi:hypothetical protein
VAAAVESFLASGEWPARRVPIVCEEPLGWIAPNVVSGTAPPPSPGAARFADPPPRGRFLLRSRLFHRLAHVELVQGDRVLWRGRLRRLMPGRSASLPAGWTREVDLDGQPVVCRLVRPG